MKPDDIKKLLQLMDEWKLAELEIEDKGGKIKLRKFEQQTFVSQQAAQKVSHREQEPTSSEKAKSEPAKNIHVVKSPLVGTFYRSPSPGAKPFVVEGSTIDQGQVLCIVEAMKVMNELKSDAKGTVRKLLVKDAQLVEFDQPLFEIELES